MSANPETSEQTVQGLEARLQLQEYVSGQLLLRLALTHEPHAMEFALNVFENVELGLSRALFQAEDDQQRLRCEKALEHLEKLKESVVPVLDTLPTTDAN